jgi:hypothetical protein
MYVYIYIYICVCVCENILEREVHGGGAIAAHHLLANGLHLKPSNQIFHFEAATSGGAAVGWIINHKVSETFEIAAHAWSCVGETIY